MVFNRSKKLKIICSLFILCTIALMPLAGISHSSAQAAELSGIQEAPRWLPLEEPLPPGTTECKAANSSLLVETSTYQLPQIATGRHILYVGKLAQPSSPARLDTQLAATSVSTKEMFDGRCISWAREIDGADVDIFSTKDLFWIGTTVEWVEGAEEFLNELLKALSKAYGLPEPIDCQVTDSLSIPMVNPDGTIDVVGMQVVNSPSPNFYSLTTKGEAVAGYGVSENAVAMEISGNQVNWIVQTGDGIKKVAAMTYHRQESNEGEGLNNTVRNPFTEIGQAPPASPDLSHTDYVIMYRSSLSGWSNVINALHAKHSDYQDLTFINEVSEKLGDLQTIKPKYVIIVIEPEDADPDFFDDVDSAMCQIDADEFEDAVWSVITGFTAADALALVNAPDATNDHTLTIANPDGSLPGHGHVGAYLAGIISDDATNGGGSPTKYVNTATSSASIINASNLQTEVNSDNKDCVLFLDHGNTYGWALREDPSHPGYSDWFYAGRSSLETFEEWTGTYYTLNNNKNSFIYSEACLTSRINGKRNTSWTPWEEDADNPAGDKATSIALAWMQDSPGFYVSNDAVNYGRPHIKTVLLNMMKFGYTPAKAVQISKNVYHYIIGDETSEDNPSDGHVDDLLLYLEREFVGLGDTSWDISIAGSPPNYSISYTAKEQQDQEATTRGYVYVDNDIKYRCTTSLNFNDEIYHEFGVAAGDREQSPFTSVYVKDVTGLGGSVYGYARAVMAGIFKPTMDVKSIDFVNGNPSDSGKLCDDLSLPPPGSSQADEMFKCKENTDELIWVVMAGATDADNNSKPEWRINNGYSKSFPVYYYLPGVEQTVGAETVVDSNTRQKSVTLKNQGSQAVANIIAKVPVPSDASNFSVMPSTGINNIIKTSDGGAYCEFTLDSIAAGATNNLILQYDIAAGPNPPIVTTNAATLVEETTATLNGIVTNDGGEACQYRFGYSTTQGGPYTYTTWSIDTKTTGQSFSQAISGLNKGSKYYFIAEAKNSVGTGSGSELTFLTKPDAPSNFSATAAGTSQINLSWTKGGGAQKTKIQRKQGSYPLNRDDGTQVYFDTGTSTSDTGLLAGTTYYYRAWSYVEGSEQWSDNYAEASAITEGGPGQPDIRTPIDTVSFSDVNIGNNLDKKTTIYNDGNAILTINSVTRTSGSLEFSYVGPATPFDIAPLASQDITIRFTPTSEGLKNATFNVNSNDTDEANVTFDASGNGVIGGPPDITVFPTSFDVTLPPNIIQDYALTISNDGGATLTYSISDKETAGGVGAAGREDVFSIKSATMVLEVPLESKPVELQNTREAQSGWQDIMTDNFEGAFPGVWELWVNPGATDAYWGKDNYRAHGGSYSAFCAKSGSAGVDPPIDYPNNMDAWMIYGPFSLEDAIDAELSFYCWLDTEYDYDYLWWGASVDGEYFYGWMWDGNSGGWVSESLDLSRVPILWNICGESQVWIAFVFVSDEIVTDKGAFIDDVVLRKYVGDTNNPPNTPSNPLPANHATGVSINADLSWTGGDPDTEDIVTYDVYFGISPTPPLVSDDQSATTYDPGTLSDNTKYYWKVVATDNHGVPTVGSLWDFTTGEVTEECPWLDESPKSGSVTAGGSKDITVTINTAGLTVGNTYTAEIIIANNDLDENPKVVPVTLRVQPAVTWNCPLGGCQLIAPNPGKGRPDLSVPAACEGITSSVGAKLWGIYYLVETGPQAGTWLWYIPGFATSTLIQLEPDKYYWVVVSGPCTLTIPQ